MNRFVSRATAVAASSALFVLACSSSNSNNPATDGGSSSGADAGTSSTPTGTAAVTSAPFPVCQSVPLGYTTPNAYATPSTPACASAGAAATGAADTHCVGQTPQPISGADCDDSDAGDASDIGPDGGEVSDYGATMYGTEGDDDDCKYHVSWTSTPICENNNTYFVVTATSLTKTDADGGPAPVTGASTQIEAFMGDTHPAPPIDGVAPSGKQTVVEGPPGTYTIGPIQFDASGQWTIRYHFNEFCCDVADDSPHGHAAFYINVP
jgi:hypothetical protein